LIRSWSLHTGLQSRNSQT